jgi:hypothetical protein
MAALMIFRSTSLAGQEGWKLLISRPVTARNGSELGPAVEAKLRGGFMADEVQRIRKSRAYDGKFVGGAGGNRTKGGGLKARKLVHGDKSLE